MPQEYSLIQVAGITELGAYVEAASLVISPSPRNGRFVRPALPVDHSAKIGLYIRVKSGEIGIGIWGFSSGKKPFDSPKIAFGKQSCRSSLPSKNG